MYCFVISMTTFFNICVTYSHEFLCLYGISIIVKISIMACFIEVFLSYPKRLSFNMATINDIGFFNYIINVRDTTNFTRG